MTPLSAREPTSEIKLSEQTQQHGFSQTFSPSGSGSSICPSTPLAIIALSANIQQLKFLLQNGWIHNQHQKHLRMLIWWVAAGCYNKQWTKPIKVKRSQTQAFLPLLYFEVCLGHCDNRLKCVFRRSLMFNPVWCSVLLYYFHRLFLKYFYINHPDLNALTFHLTTQRASTFCAGPECWHWT